jgi:hypothetical protein
MRLRMGESVGTSTRCRYQARVVLGLPLAKGIILPRKVNTGMRKAMDLSMDTNPDTDSGKDKHMDTDSSGCMRTREANSSDSKPKAGRQKKPETKTKAKTDTNREFYDHGTRDTTLHFTLLHFTLSVMIPTHRPDVTRRGAARHGTLEGII